jgi:hypothetical protein
MAMILIRTITAFAFTNGNPVVDEPNQERKHENEIHDSSQSHQRLGDSVMPSEQLLSEMGEELAQTGVLLAVW